MRKLILLLVCFPFLTLSQNIDHWETVVFDNDIWKYLEGTYEPDTNWRQITFDDSSWFQGEGGVGYGDGDDNTVINPVTSLYLRKQFTIIDTSEITVAILHVDYDDAFVAYLNNVEIARSNIGTVGDHPLYNQGSTSLHEAQMYQGGNPDQFVINTQLLSSVLNQGNNVLSVQVHNDNISSSDLTGRIFLSLGINTTTTNYSPTPSWFIPPLIFVLTYQRGFYVALEYAGVFVAILLIFLPAMMVWKLKKPRFYSTFWGRTLLIFIILFAFFIVAVDVLAQLGVFKHLISKYLIHV